MAGSAAGQQAVVDAAVLRRIQLGRYSNTVVRRVIGELNRVEADVVARLAQASGVDLLRLDILLAEIRAIQDAGWAVISTGLVDDLTSLGGVEADFADRLVHLGAPVGTTFSPAPTIGQVIAAVQARPFQGRLLSEWLSGTNDAIAQRVRQVIRQGFIEGQPIDQMVRALRGTASAAYRDGILEISRRGAEAMVRTAISHVASVAREETYRRNADVVQGVQWVSVLDNRTTLICISLDGQVFKIDEGPRPPAHINCRSTTVPVLAPIEGVAPYVRETYAAWLNRQPAKVQDEVLGPTRAKLYRDGGLPVDRFVDDAGRTLTLDELRQRNPGAFTAAKV